MICSVCGKLGIYWKNLAGPSPYTYCPDCGRSVPPVPEELEIEEEISEEAKGRR
jgi:hypothetical protein